MPELRDARPEADDDHQAGEGHPIARATASRLQRDEHGQPNVDLDEEKCAAKNCGNAQSLLDPMTLSPIMIPYALRFVARTMWRLITRKPLIVSREEQNKRFAICEKCAYFQPDASQCGVCFCFMRAKTLFYSETCPLPMPKW